MENSEGSPFTDDDLKRLKAETVDDHTHDGPFLSAGRMLALFARLEAAERVALAVENANTFLIGISIPKSAFYLLKWFGIDWKHILRTVSGWRKSAGK